MEQTDKKYVWWERLRPSFDNVVKCLLAGLQSKGEQVDSQEELEQYLKQLGKNSLDGSSNRLD